MAALGHRDRRRHRSISSRPDDASPIPIRAYKLPLDLDAKMAKSIHARRRRHVRVIEP